MANEEDREDESINVGANSHLQEWEVHRRTLMPWSLVSRSIDDAGCQEDLSGHELE